jgi:AcrR family transcriptional regulator
MTRIVKSAEERRAELIDCAQALFIEKGYEATTVADILARSRLSKGAFYHHFAAKEDLLDAFIEQIASTIVERSHVFLDDESLSESERLMRLLQGSSSWMETADSTTLRAYSALMRADNELLFRRISKVAGRRIAPVVTGILRRGVERGEFDVPDIDMVVEVMLRISEDRKDVVVRAIEETLAGEDRGGVAAYEHRMAAELAVLTRLLGLPDGTMQPPTRSSVDEALKALTRYS